MHSPNSCLIMINQRTSQQIQSALFFSSFVMGSFKNLLKHSTKSFFKTISNFSYFFTSCCLISFLITFLVFYYPTEIILLTPKLLTTANSSSLNLSCTLPTTINQSPIFKDKAELSPAPKNQEIEDKGQQSPAPKSQERSNTTSEIKGHVVMHMDPAFCDIFNGRWVVDNSRPSYKPGSCPFIDDSFNCFKNGRPDSNYTKLRWQPKGCRMPRLRGKKMLEMLRGKRLAFVGDSLNRNMWESLVCILRSSLRDKKRVYEITGKQEFKTDNSYVFKFIDYNCSIEFFRSSFLVQEWEVSSPNGTRKETLRLDLIENSSSKYKDADVIVFNTAHWWTHDKTSQGKDYYQEGSHVYSQLSAEEALQKALRTWAQWVDTHINPNRTRVFFRGYSSSHFGGGKWNEGGNCNGETLPITNDSDLLMTPKLVKVVESAILEMRTPVEYLNITRMTEYRKDGHPSLYRLPATDRKQATGGIQDCSHWCLPGVPDAWNEILYAMLTRKVGKS